MAIDTAEKRRSAATVGQVFMCPGVTPTALKDQEWRQEAAWGYNGVLVNQGDDMRQKVEIAGSVDYIETVSVFNPPVQALDAIANDSDKSFVVPTNEVWKLCNAHITLVTDATVGNRQMVLEIQNTASEVVFSSAAGAVQAASLTRIYDYMQGITKETAFVGTVIQVPIPTELYILPGYSLRVYDSAAIAAATDDMTVAFQAEKLVV